MDSAMGNRALARCSLCIKNNPKGSVSKEAHTVTKHTASLSHFSSQENFPCSLTFHSSFALRKVHPTLPWKGHLRRTTKRPLEALSQHMILPP